MDTIAALVRAGREREGVAIEVADRSAPYSYRELCTNVWKAGNLLGHYTHPGGSVAVVPGPKRPDDGPDLREPRESGESEAPGGSGESGDKSTQHAETGRERSIDCADPVLAVLGGTLVGTRVTLTPETPVGADTVVRPAGAGARALPGAAGGVRCWPYGGPPEPSSVEHFEAALWSENPVEPPESVGQETPGGGHRRRDPQPR
jgi:hypothetical protein